MDTGTIIAESLAARVTHLGIEFFDAIDPAIARIVEMPQSGVRVPRLPLDLPARRLAVTRFPYHVVYHVVYLELPTHIRILAIAPRPSEARALAQPARVVPCRVRSSRQPNDLPLSRERRSRASRIRWNAAAPRIGCSGLLGGPG
jgi:hypothetical protein